MAAAASRLMTKDGLLLLDRLRPVDQAVDGGRAVAALAAQHVGGLAGEGAEGDLAVDALGEVAGERGLARAGIAEQAEDLRPPAFSQAGTRLKRLVLLRRPFHPIRPAPCERQS